MRTDKAEPLAAEGEEVHGPAAQDEKEGREEERDLPNEAGLLEIEVQRRLEVGRQPVLEEVVGVHV